MFGPGPASLPSDHITMDGWLRNVLTWLAFRSAYATDQLGGLASELVP